MRRSPHSEAPAAPAAIVRQRLRSTNVPGFRELISTTGGCALGVTTGILYRPESLALVPVALRLSLPLPTAPTLSKAKIVADPPGPSNTLDTLLPFRVSPVQKTFAEVPQERLYVLLERPVFRTVKLSL